MKPITFESIRNFLKTKKKTKKDGGDTSFKRSDSFKRISIRKSYMDRGRKRAILRSANVGMVVAQNAIITKNSANHSLTAAEVEVKNDAFISSSSGGRSSSATGSSASVENHIPIKPKRDMRSIEAGGSFCFKNKSLQEINELCGAGEDIGTDDEQMYRDRRKASVSPLKRPTEIQTVAMDFGRNNKGDRRKCADGRSSTAQIDTKNIDKNARRTSNSCEFIYKDLRTNQGSSTRLPQRKTRSRDASLSPSSSYVIQKPVRKVLSQRSESGFTDSKTTAKFDGRRSNSVDRSNMIKYERLYNSSNNRQRDINSADRQIVNVGLKSRDSQSRRSTSILASNYKTDITVNHRERINYSPLRKYSDIDIRHDSASTASIISSDFRKNQNNVSVNGSIIELQDSLLHASPVPQLSRAIDVTRTTYNGIPSLVTFKTFSNEPSNPYLETSFDLADLCSNTHSLESTRSNLSQSSLSPNRVIVNKPFAINSQTYKMNKDAVVARKSNIDGESIVIRIPASVDDIMENNGIIHPHKQNIVKQVSNDSALDVNENDFEKISSQIVNEETSLNGKFTFEIYKELQRTRGSGSGDAKYRPATIHESGQSINEEKMSSFESHKANHKDLPHDPSSNSSDNTLDTSFKSLCLDEKRTKNNNFYFEEPEMTAYNDGEVISPDSSIPYPLRVKINPFTQQKEPYSVNLGRVWKQLNLGQDDLSIDASTNTNTQQSQNNVKIKNESFKSMSSRDSGFSLTLTKPKNIFGRKPVKKTRCKSKIILGRDGYWKRAFQPDSTRRKKKRPAKHPIASPFVTANGMMDESFYQTFSRYYKNRYRHLENQLDDSDADELGPEIFAEHEAIDRDYKDNEKFLQEFQNFCAQRRRLQHEQFGNKTTTVSPIDALPSLSSIQSSPYLLKNFNKLLRYEDGDVDHENITQEISDLEAFFEEHLKRLKEYYLQKKRFTEQKTTLADNLHEQLMGKISDEYRKEAYFIATNDTLKRKQKIKNKHRSMKQLVPMNIRNDDPEPQLFDKKFDFSFPHPDKRDSQNNSKKKNKFQTQEVREFSNDSLKYASLEFQNENPFANLCSSYEDSVPYADIQFQTSNYLDFPYGKIRSKESRRLTRHKYKKSFERKSIDSIINTMEINPNLQLSSIFPSINSSDSPKSTMFKPKVCEICLKEQQQQNALNNYRNQRDEIDEYDDDDDDVDDDEYENIDSDDEFSENEFIANSLGGELCLICDKMHSECVCSLETIATIESVKQQRKQKPSRNFCYCDCTSGVYTSTMSNRQLNKRQIKRIKIRRRLGNNHSTLRRGFNYSSSKFLAFQSFS